MSYGRKTHADTHPSGHPNRTAVNTENPIFGRPADPIPEVSFQQAAVVQSEKHPRETVQSPLLSETSAGYPKCVPLESMTDIYEPGENRDPDVVFVSPSPLGTRVVRTVGSEPVVENTEALTGQSAEEVGVVQQSEQAQDSSPSAEDPDAVASETVAKEATGGETEQSQNAAVDSQFTTGQKVKFAPESGNDTETVYTIDGSELHEDQWFWRLVELPGLFLGRNLMLAGLAEV